MRNRSSIGFSIHAPFRRSVSYPTHFTSGITFFSVSFLGRDFQIGQLMTTGIGFSLHLFFRLSAISSWKNHLWVYAGAFKTVVPNNSQGKNTANDYCKGELSDLLEVLVPIKGVRNSIKTLGTMANVFANYDGGMRSTVAYHCPNKFSSDFNGILPT